jgi:hypothetical protein
MDQKGLTNPGIHAGDSRHSAYWGFSPPVIFPPAGYFFLDEKVAKKSRPSRKLPD